MVKDGVVVLWVVIAGEGFTDTFCLLVLLIRWAFILLYVLVALVG